MKKSPKPLIDYLPDLLDYCDVVKGLSSKSIEDYHRFLNKFIGWLKIKKLEDLKPDELTSDHIYEYRLYLSRSISSKDGQNLKKNTQNYYLIALRALLSFLIKQDILTLPPDKISLAKDKNVKKVHFLNLEQIERLLLSPALDKINGLRDRAILEALFSTGLRIGELAALNRDQINSQYLKKYSKGGFELPVTGKGGFTRTVYFSERSLAWLLKYLEKRADNDKALFINFKKTKKQTEKRLSVRSMEIIIKRYVKQAGLPINTTPHTLRHSYATDLLNQGVDIRLVQEFLGHQNISTTQIYTHVTNKRLRDVHKQFHSGDKLKNY